MTLRRLAELLRSRNAIDAELASIIGRPPQTGHLGEWIAAQVFDIQLEHSASTKAIDGRFCSGPLAGRTVNVKCYLKQESVLDMTNSGALDYYLVMCGPVPSALTSRGGTRPFVIESVYLFDAQDVKRELLARGAKVGIASSILRDQWRAAEIFPTQTNPLLSLSAEKRGMLALFSGES